MQERVYNIRISPGVIKNDIFPKIWYGGDFSYPLKGKPCCDYKPVYSGVTTGTTYVYSSMTQILSGGTNGESLLDITLPIFLSENTVDIGYYNVFDGLIDQQDTMLNFLFESSTSNPFVYSFYNTSDNDFKKYLSFSSYQIDWGDGTQVEIITEFSPTPYIHTYAAQGEYTISMSGLSPWGYNIITKNVYLPYSDITIDNPNGEAFFVPTGGSWSGIPISYNYIYHYDETCNENIPCCDFTTVPFLVTGYTKSSLTDLQQYGKVKYVVGREVTGASGNVMVYKGPSQDNSYTAYTINNIDYYDFPNGVTLFVVESSGCTDLSCSAITKNEVLLNVISEAEVQTNVFIERGKNSALEMIQRLGEINNIGELEQYGYKFYNIVKI